VFQVEDHLAQKQWAAFGNNFHARAARRGVRSVRRRRRLGSAASGEHEQAQRE
jgi:hypothetical protein